MVWDWRVSRAGPMPFCWPSWSLLFCLQLFSLLFFSSIGWWCWAGVFGLIGCQFPCPGLALPIFFNNNNNICIYYYSNVDYRVFNLNPCILTKLDLFPASAHEIVPATVPSFFARRNSPCFGWSFAYQNEIILLLLLIQHCCEYRWLKKFIPWNIYFLITVNWKILINFSLSSIALIID